MDSGVLALDLAVKANLKLCMRLEIASRKEAQAPHPVSHSLTGSASFWCVALRRSTGLPGVARASRPFGTFQNRMKGPSWIWRNSVLGRCGETSRQAKNGRHRARHAESRGYEWLWTAELTSSVKWDHCPTLHDTVISSVV